eukprot:m.173997 g.173997  ORF g.173997 m.173997 type:complete len:64 (-) comp10413_c1_seq1:1893-2084(-)
MPNMLLRISTNLCLVVPLPVSTFPNRLLRCLHRERSFRIPPPHLPANILAVPLLEALLPASAL